MNANVHDSDRRNFGSLAAYRRDKSQIAAVNRISEYLAHGHAAFTISFSSIFEVLSSYLPSAFAAIIASPLALLHPQ